MSHFYETIANEIDFALEQDKIKTVFEDEENDLGFTYGSLFELIDTKFFRLLKIACNYISLSAFLEDAVRQSKNSSDYFIYYSEALISLTYQLSKYLGV